MLHRWNGKRFHQVFLEDEYAEFLEHVSSIIVGHMLHR